MHLLHVSLEISFVTADKICLVLKEDFLNIFSGWLFMIGFLFSLLICAQVFFSSVSFCAFVFPQKPLFTESLTVTYMGVLLLEGIWTGTQRCFQIILYRVKSWIIEKNSSFNPLLIFFFFLLPRVAHCQCLPQPIEKPAAQQGGG